jgi:DUF1009 family protein
MQPERKAAADLAAIPMLSANQPLAIICGGGSFPGAVAAAAQRRGFFPVLFAIKGWADPELVAQFSHHWIALGQLGRLLRLAKSERCRDALLIGTLLRPSLSQIRLDWRTVRSLPTLARAYRGGDDRLLLAVARLIERGGVRIIGVEDVAPEIIVAKGALGRYRPSKRDDADIARALEVIAALGPLDVGQAAVVADHRVLAIEAAEGTDEMLARISQLRAQGRLSTPPGIGVLVKEPKATQDRRFDLPAIGPRTIENAARAGLAGVAIVAGSTIIAEPVAVVAAADRAEIFIVGIGGEAAL